MKKTGKVSVAVVEDELCTRVGLLTLLSGWPVGRVLFEAADGVDFEEQCARHGVPDLVLVDFKLPRRDGLQLLAWMKERQLPAKALVVTRDPGLRRAQAVLAAGARGVLAKTATREEFYKALEDVRTTEHHHNHFTSQLLAHAGKPLPPDDAPDPELDRLKVKEELSPRGYEVLELLAEGYSLPQVAKRLKLSLKTVQDYRDQIYERLDIHDRVALARFAMRFSVVRG